MVNSAPQYFGVKIAIYGLKKAVPMIFGMAFFNYLITNLYNSYFL
jgi:hypothetical protein